MASSAMSATSNFAVQVAALSDPLRARSVVHDLSAAGYNAYVVSPGAATPTRPIAFASAGTRREKPPPAPAARLGRLRGEKLWVIPSARPRGQISIFDFQFGASGPISTCRGSIPNISGTVGNWRSDPGVRSPRLENRDLTPRERTGRSGRGGWGRRAGAEKECQAARAEAAAGPAGGGGGAGDAESAADGARRPRPERSAAPSGHPSRRARR